MVYVQDGTIENPRDAINTIRQGQGASYCSHPCTIDRGGQRWLMRNDDHRRLARVNSTQLSAESMPGNYLQISDVYFDIQITGAPVHTLKNLILHVSVINQAAVTVKPLVPFYFFNRVECQANGGFTDDTIYPWTWYQHFVTTTSFARKTTMSPTLFMSTGSPEDTSVVARTLWNMYDEIGSAMAIGATRQYYIPFDCNFLVQSVAWLKSKSVNPRFRFYGSLNPICSDSVTDPDDMPATSLLINGAEFIVSGIVYTPTLADKLNNHYKSGHTISRVLCHERQIFDLSSYVPGSETSDQSLTALSGEYAGLWFFVQRAEASREQLYGSNRTYTAATQGFLPIDYVSLKDSSGNPVQYLKMPSELHRYHMMSRQYPDSMLSTFKEVYYFPFSGSGALADTQGISTGGLLLDAKFQFQITAGTYTAGATVAYKQVFHAQRFAIICLTSEGKFTITKL